jgi:hypothetical protein
LTAGAAANSDERSPEPFTLDHFRRYVRLMVWDDDEQRDLDGWQLEVVDDIFRAIGEVW